jgi:hypothetical protein
MDMAGILRAIEAMPLAGAMRGDSPGTGWMFPIVNIFHVLALALVFGSISMVDLRLLGITSRSSLVSKLSAEVLPWTWSAYALAVISGSMMFISKAHTYWGNFEFRMKFVCMFLAGVNMLVFHFGVYRHVKTWNSVLPPPNAARVAGGLSLLLWLGVIFFGRWVGWTS